MGSELTSISLQQSQILILSKFNAQLSSQFKDSRDPFHIIGLIH